MRKPTEEQRDRLTREETSINKVEVAIAISQAVAVLMGVLVMGQIFARLIG